MRQVPLESVPTVLFLPAYSKAGILTRQVIQQSYPVRLITATRATGSPFPFLAKDEKAVIAGLGPDRFAQMLGKIALGIAVAKLGPDGFLPLVQDFILSRPGEFGHWVGGPADHDGVPSKKLHEIEIVLETHEDQKFWVVYVRLFANLGGPRNYVVVGLPVSTGPARQDPST